MCKKCSKDDSFYQELIEGLSSDLDRKVDWIQLGENFDGEGKHNLIISFEDEECLCFSITQDYFDLLKESGLVVQG